MAAARQRPRAPLRRIVLRRALLRRATAPLLAALAAGCKTAPPPPDPADLPDRFTGSAWELEPPHLGEETFTHWPEGSAHKNRMQGNDYVQSRMYVTGVTCSACHDVHGTEHAADLIAPGNAVCTSCHQPELQPGPAGSLEYQYGVGVAAPRVR